MRMKQKFEALLQTFFDLKYSINRSPAVSKDEQIVFGKQLTKCEGSVKELAALAESLDRTMQRLDAQLQSYDVENGDLKGELEKSGDFVSFLLDKSNRLTKELELVNREASDYRYDYHTVKKENLKLQQKIAILEIDLAFKKLENR